MIVASFLVLVALVVAWVVRRRRRAVQLAALTADKPAFHVEPPHRRISSRKYEVL